MAAEQEHMDPVALSDSVKSTGVTGLTPLSELVGWDIQCDSPTDPMHFVRVIVHHLVSLMKAKKRKRKRKKSSGSAANVAGARANNHADHDSDDVLVLDSPDEEAKRAAFVLSQAQQDEADRRYTSLRGPPGFTNPRAPPFKCSGLLKNYDWNNFVKYHGEYILSGLVAGTEQAAVISRLFKCLATAVSEDVTPARIPAERAELVRMLVDFERLFPRSELRMCLHSTLHWPDARQLWGPAKGFWMYPWERFVGSLAWMITSRKNPELNLVRRYAQFRFHMCLTGAELRRARCFAQGRLGYKQAGNIGLGLPLPAARVVVPAHRVSVGSARRIHTLMSKLQHLDQVQHLLLYIPHNNSVYH